MELIYISCPLAPGNKAVLVLNTLVCPHVTLICYIWTYYVHITFKHEILKIAHFSDTSSKRRFHYSADTLDSDRAAPLLTVHSVFCSGLSRKSCWGGSLAGRGRGAAQRGRTRRCAVPGWRVCTAWCTTSLPCTSSAPRVSTAGAGVSPDLLCPCHSSLLLRCQMGVFVYLRLK